jgi:polyisoprenoid-binding protein YceI
MSPTHTGTYTLGPTTASLKVWTGKEGKAAMAGHNLEIEVSDWSATLSLGDSPEATALTLSANSRSLRTLAGSGGMQKLGDDDRSNIDTTIDDEVLKGGEITFKSTGVHGVDGTHDLHVHGDLTVLGKTTPVAFTFAVEDDDSFSGEALIKQSDFGMKPYSALFGTLKVKDELRVTVEGKLSGRQSE